MNRKLMIGCGIGCGLMALVFAVLVGGGAWFARNMNKEYKVVRETEETLVKAHGEVADYVPPVGVVPAPARVTAFVAVRAATAEWRRRLAGATSGFATERAAAKGIGGLVNAIRSGSELAPLYAGFWSSRNAALLAQGMGPGEYTWLYGLVYYGWLGRDAAAGSGEVRMQGTGENGLRVEVSVGEQEDAARRQRRRSHRLLAPLLKRALGDPAGVTAEELAAERERLETDARRMPWQTDLPPLLAESFAPHRAALEAAWNDLVNPVEFIFDAENWANDGVDD